MNDLIFIDDVEKKELITHLDQRGYFREIIRVNDPFFGGFGQWSVSAMWSGVIKAWHIHQIQYDYWYVPMGNVKAVLCDMREDSLSYLRKQEFLLGADYPPIVLKIPPGVAHGLKVLQGPAYLFYITTEVYNPDDEGRIPFDDPVIGYDWHREEIT